MTTMSVLLQADLLAYFFILPNNGAADTFIILSIIGVASSYEALGLEIKKSIGRIPDNIEYFRQRRPITPLT